MKCINCGAEFSAKDLKCPYCGTQNEKGIQWQEEEKMAQDALTKEKKRTIKEGPLYVINQIANRILAVTVILAVLTVAGNFVYFFIQDKITQQRQKKGSYEEANAFIENEDFEGFCDYMDTYELWSYPDNTYVELKDVYFCYRELEEFREDRMLYAKAKRRLNNEDDYGSSAWYVGNMMEACGTALSLAEDTDSKRAMKYQEARRQMATAFLISEFSYSQEEIENIAATPTYEDTFDEIVKDAFERKGWKYEKNL